MTFLGITPLVWCVVLILVFSLSGLPIGSPSTRLLDWCNGLVGRFRGGMGRVDVVSSQIFSGMSGSAIADVVGVGKLTMDIMTRNGRYPPEYSAAITAATMAL